MTHVSSDCPGSVRKDRTSYSSRTEPKKFIRIALTALPLLGLAAMSVGVVGGLLFIELGVSPVIYGLLLK